MPFLSVGVVSISRDVPCVCVMSLALSVSMGLIKALKLFSVFGSFSALGDLETFGVSHGPW